jgi:glutamine synthetase
VNSYKRFMKGTFAPTKTVWSVDNRTAGFRLCGEGTKAVRVECRIGGIDINPYLALRGAAGCGHQGHRGQAGAGAARPGDVYETRKPPSIPLTLRAATETLRNSKMLREAMGDWVVDHYTRCAEGSRKNSTRRYGLGNRTRFRKGLTMTQDIK